MNKNVADQIVHKHRLISYFVIHMQQKQVFRGLSTKDSHLYTQKLCLMDI